METGPDWAGLRQTQRVGGLGLGLDWVGRVGSPGLTVGVPLSGSGPGPDSLLLQPLAPAPLWLCCYLWGLDGKGWGGCSIGSPPAQTGWEGEERRSRATAWEGATELQEEGGLEEAQRQDPTDTVTQIFPFAQHPHPASQRDTHLAVVHAHTHIHTEK